MVFHTYHTATISYLLGPYTINLKHCNVQKKYRKRILIKFVLIMLGLKSKLFLFPYWCILAIRNKLYDKGYKKSERHEIPVISLGNITVGGTGKTPHTEMIVRLLKDRYKIAVISRGYKRKSKGFHIVQITDDYTLCGDEPLQIKLKFPDIVVAVCKDRNLAIKKVREDYGVNMVILDDAFQYRKITPSCNILLVNYNNSISNGDLLPIGSLRDLPSQTKRADIVIITKSPNFALEDGNEYDDIALERVNAEEIRWRKELSLKEEQKIFFSTLKYEDIKPIFEDCANRRYIYSKFVICFSGIANDYHFKSQLVGTYKIVGQLKFSDHNNYSQSDINKIVRLARRQSEAALITTEKDCMRLKNNPYIPADIKERLFYLPVDCKVIPPIKLQEFLNSIQRKVND